MPAPQTTTKMQSNTVYSSHMKDHESQCTYCYKPLIYRETLIRLFGKIQQIWPVILEDNAYFYKLSQQTDSQFFLELFHNYQFHLTIF
jgi:hypothetical protein